MTNQATGKKGIRLQQQKKARVRKLFHLWWLATLSFTKLWGLSGSGADIHSNLTPFRLPDIFNRNYNLLTTTPSTTNGMFIGECCPLSEVNKKKSINLSLVLGPSFFVWPEMPSEIRYLYVQWHGHNKARLATIRQGISSSCHSDISNTAVL